MSRPKKLSVLIAEDDALVIDVIQNHLEKAGYEVTDWATDGRRVVEMVQSLQPDLVLMDIQMPEMDGLEAARQIQEKCPKPVVLLTSHDDPELVKQASRVGVGAYLVKPPNQRELERAITIAMARFADLQELRRLNAELQQALATVKVLSGLLPMCASCKKIRDDKGCWTQVETYIMQHSEATFSHGICPDCFMKLYPEYYKPNP